MTAYAILILNYFGRGHSGMIGCELTGNVELPAMSVLTHFPGIIYAMIGVRKMKASVALAAEN